MSEHRLLPTLGVLGGMGPAATVEFLRRFTEAWPARRDQDHPRLIVLSEPGIPDRTAALTEHGVTPLPPVLDSLHRLAEWGADLIAVPCNTVFAFLDPAQVELGVPIVDLVAVTLAAARRVAPGGCWLLATEGTIHAGLYHRDTGYPLALPTPAQQDRVNAVIDAVKAGEHGVAGRLFTELGALLSAIRAVPLLLGCTELAIACQASTTRVPVVDSVDVLARTCVARIGALVSTSW